MKCIEKLLQGAEVEWKKLGEVVEIVTDFTAAGSFASNAKNVTYLKEPSYALLVRTTDLKQRFTNSDNFVYVDDHAFNYLWRVNLNNESIILPNVGNCGEVYYSVPTELPYDRCVLGPNALLLRSSIIGNKFLFYWFQGADFQNKLSKIISSTGQTKFNKTNLKHILIPIPPLHVQQEIVRILDKFTELELRKQQYERYRDLLLSPDDPGRRGINTMIELGEIGEVRMCKRILKRQTSAVGDIPFYKIGTFGKTADAYIPRELFETYKAKYNYPNKGEILISASGTIGRSVIFDGKESYFQDSNIVWIENNERFVLNKYLFYCYQIIQWNVADGGTIDRLYNDYLKKTRIPVPYLNDAEKSLKEQQRIVSVLDKFHTLTTSISEGLPREIELRKQQYAYYRDQLLSFER